MRRSANEYSTLSFEEAVSAAGTTQFAPTTFDNCARIAGPFFHGTAARLAAGDLLVAGHGSNFEEGRVSNNVYFTALLEGGVLAAQLAVRLIGAPSPGHVYEVEPTGPFEDDPNLTNKRFPGNVTRSYRSREPVRVVCEVIDWTPLPAERIEAMVDNLARLRAEGLAVIED